jgi:DNA primase
MINQFLVMMTDSILGAGKPTSRGNYAYHCAFCNHHKPKLEVNFTTNKDNTNPWACWACGEKGKKLISLFRKLKAPSNKIEQLKSYLKIETPEYEDVLYVDAEIKLPKEYISLSNIKTKNISTKHALHYLKKRGITNDDIVKYNIGYCEYGDYSNRIIIPSYNSDCKLNYFTSRSFEDNAYKYKNPTVSRDIIPFELFINWNLPLILCEGPFDAIAIKRNVIPLFGKTIQNELMKKIVKSTVEKIYIILDKDAIKKALDFCQHLMDEGKEVYFVEMQDKDASDVGFYGMIDKLHNTMPLTFSKLYELKLNI